MLVLPKQAGDSLHRKKKTASDGRKQNKPEMLIELYRTRIDCIHDDRGRGDFGGLHQRAVQGIQKKKLADTS